MTEPSPLAGLRVLVAEDDFLIADALRQDLASQGATIWGPVPDIAGAIALLDRDGPPDLAVIDLHLRDDLAYPVADRLRRLGVPFLFATGYGADAIAEGYRDVPRCEKPGDVLPRLGALLAARAG